MNIFDVVNELAVFGVTLFMMAVNTIWYSGVLFGPTLLRAIGISHEDNSVSTQQELFTSGLTFVSYFLILIFVAYGVSVASVLDVSVLTFALCAWAFATAAFFSATVFEHRSIGYYIATVGFQGVFIVGGAYMLLFWPW